MGDLDHAIVSVVETALGRTLSGIFVRSLDGELTSREQLSDPDLYIGGEVRLRFDDEHDLFVSWVQNQGWPVFCSIGARANSHFLSGALQDWDPSDLEPWCGCIGSALSSARVLGRDGTPHIAELSFGTATLWLGNGYELEFGDGTDLLIRWNALRPVSSDWEVMWSSSTPID